MELSRVVLEGGIELQTFDGEWDVLTGEKPYVRFQMLPDALAHLRPRRIVVADSVRMGLASSSVVMDPNGKADPSIKYQLKGS